MNKLIKLKPLDYYYFGGEETFDNGAKGLKNFHVKSNLLPQQTGITGLIRHQLILAGFNIGNKSFDGISVPQWESLISISPLFLINHKNQFLIPCPSVINEILDPVQISFEYKDHTFRNGNWQNETIKLKGYDAKKGLTHCWLNLSTNERITESIIFISKNHIGINKAKRIEQQDDKGAFYQQEYISLNSEYCFCAIAEFSDNIDTDNLGKLMPFGGEKRSFEVSYVPSTSTWEQIKSQAVGIFSELIPRQLSIVLLSDTYVENLPAFYSNIKGGIIHSKPFRNIITPGNIKSVNFARLTKMEGQTDQLRKSGGMLKLLERGSVIFPNDLHACIQLLTNNIYSSIGYNQFVIINQS